MSGLMGAVGAWPIWDLTLVEWAVFGALLIVVLNMYHLRNGCVFALNS